VGDLVLMGEGDDRTAGAAYSGMPALRVCDVVAVAVAVVVGVGLRRRRQQGNREHRSTRQPKKSHHFTRDDADSRRTFHDVQLEACWSVVTSP
jgi:hypothetical protein